MIRALLLWYVSLRHFVHIAAIVAYMGFIFFLSSQEFSLDIEMTLLWAMIFNLCHVPLYLGLSVLITLYLRKIFKISEKSGSSLAYGFMAVAALLVYGLSDEYHQSFTGRTPSLLDLASDLVGGVLGVLLVSYLIDAKLSRTACYLYSGGLALAAVTIAYFGSV
jgi:VanZ family protein